MRLEVIGPDLTRYEFANVPSDARVRDIVDAYVEFSASPMLSLLADNPQRQVVDSVHPTTGESIRLSPGATLSASHITDGAVIRIGVRAWAGGLHPPDLISFVSASIAAGVTGNLAYDLLKVSLQEVRTRWARQRNLSFERDEAVELTRASICLNFALDEPAKLCPTGD